MTATTWLSLACALVRDAMQLRGVNKKRLLQYRRDYEDELRRSDPTYLAEKSLEAQNQRLVHELKRAEKLLAELNRDHCDLAGQLVTLRLELAQEREVSAALKRQVHDLFKYKPELLPGPELSKEERRALVRTQLRALLEQGISPLSFFDRDYAKV